MTYKLACTVICMSVAICAATDDAKGLEVARTRATLNAIVTEAAVKHSVPPQLATALVLVESGFNSFALSAGNYGLMQIRCPTARGVGFRGDCRELLDPFVNVEYGMRYLAQALEQSHGDWCNAATMYNRGLGYVPSRSTKY